MAKSSEPTTKEPGRFRQLVDVFKMTAKYDKAGVVMIAAVFVLPIVLAIVLSIFLYPGNWLMWILSIVLGILFGVLLAMLMLNRRAEKVAFDQLEGRQGAVGAVITSALRGKWRTSDMPVAFNPKTQDLVFRAIGKPGVVLITESNSAASKRLLNDERKKTQRLVPTVPVHHVLVGEGGIKLTELKSAMKKLPKQLRKDEILAVDTRLASLKRDQMPIPKGIDPNRIRSSRSQMR
ncbi:DUF4191 domain-containing protein [Gulosibacter sp. 10]|uniref:DUF4191 domain-containing protein n=1 Tax=Gulosibacter sp. 10 TaxID=1255570 RepID=UPI001594F8D0|nr:DUF4191 domain-containing protein [Gulosibacter sp. 10]